jgi:NAD(P)H-nitrite reductase large subunit
MRVTHCVCFDVSLEELKRISDERGLDLEGLREETGCTSGCAMCEPYIRVMLRTGETAVPLMSRDEARAALDGRDA